MSYLKFKDDDNVLCIYSKKDYNFNFRLLGLDYLSNEEDRLCNELNIKPKGIVVPYQSHTNNIVIVNEDNYRDEFKDVDGVLTNVRNIGLGTLSADCENILLYDSKKNVIGSVHSGWRGTLNNIIGDAISKMIDYYDSDVNDIECFITPSILKCCFEVKDDVISLFLDRYGDKYIIYNNDKCYIDLINITIDNIKKLGVNKINYTDICVRCNSNVFHSYRADGKDSGRNLAFIILK